MPASSIGRTELDEELTSQGARVLRITAYENRPPDPATVELPAALTEGRLDCILFASPSSARNFLEIVGPTVGRQYLQNVAIAAIGPTTARAVEELGFTVTIQPADSSIPALVAALCDHYGRR